MTRSRAALFLFLLFAPGCLYSSNRGQDFLEIFRLQGGIGRGLGVTASAVGLLHVGLNTPGQFPHRSGLGFVYGDVYFLSGAVSDIDFMRGLHDETLCVDHANLEYAHSHKCWAVLPAVFSRVDTFTGPDYPETEDPKDWVEGPWLWSREALDADPWAHVHAFDGELGIYLLILNLKAGLSPGEAVDFLLGIFTIDIARDDFKDTEE